jgi:hypothetical protein
VELNDNNKKCNGCRKIIDIERNDGLLSVDEKNGRKKREMF